MELTFQLPDKAHLIAKKGVKISFGEPFYTVSQGEEVTINISSKLGIDPSQIFQYISLVIGEKVTVGSVLGEKKTLLGKKTVQSQYSGIVNHIDHSSGAITIKTASETNQQVPAFFFGLITDYRLNTQIVKVSFENGFLFDLKEVSGDGGGMLLYFNNEIDYFNLTEEQIKDKFVVIIESKAHLEAKFEALSVAGYLFLKGEIQTDLPFGKVRNISDFEKLRSGKYQLVAISASAKKGVAYLL